MLTYTGYLKTAAGSPVTTASLLTFRLYLGAAEPTPVWSEQIDVVPTSDGWFSAVLGSVTPIPGIQRAKMCVPSPGDVGLALAPP